MQSLLQHWPWRVLWLAFGAGVGLYFVSDGIASNLVGPTVIGAGFLVFGVVWFFQPTRLNVSPIRNFQAAVQMSRPLQLLSAVAITFVIGGALLTYAFHL